MIHPPTILGKVHPPPPWLQVTILTYNLKSQFGGQKPAPITDGVHKNDRVDAKNSSLESRSEAIKRLKPLKLKELLAALDCSQCLIFCRTNLDCDNLEQYLTSLGGGQGFRGKVEKGVENPYSCVVMAGQRGNDERRENLQANLS